MWPSTLTRLPVPVLATQPYSNHPSPVPFLYFFGLPHLSFTRTVPMAFHFCTTFLTVEIDSPDNFLYPSPNS